MLNLKPKTLLAIAVLLTVAAVAAFVLLRPTAQPVPTASPKPTPSATPTPLLSAEDRALVERLSQELATKFNTYQRPDDPAYLRSIKPYLDQVFYKKTAADIGRYRGRLTHVKPTSAEIGQPKLKEDSTTQVTVSIPVTIRSGDFSEKTTAQIKWEKRGQRWVALYILNSTSGQNRNKYGEG